VCYILARLIPWYDTHWADLVVKFLIDSLVCYTPARLTVQCVTQRQDWLHSVLQTGQILKNAWISAELNLIVKYFYPWIRGPAGIALCKKRGQKSRCTVPLESE